MEGVPIKILGRAKISARKEAKRVIKRPVGKTDVVHVTRNDLEQNS